MSSNKDQLTINNEPAPTIFRQQWLYLAGNDNLVGKIGITTRIVRRMEEHKRAANMRHIMSHRTPTAAEIERALKHELRPWIISGTEWIDLSHLAPCSIIAHQFEELGADTIHFRRWLSERYRYRYGA